MEKRFGEFMKKNSKIICMCMLVTWSALAICACGSKTETIPNTLSPDERAVGVFLQSDTVKESGEGETLHTDSREESEVEIPEYTLRTSPPELYLSAASGSEEMFQIRSGNYTWNYSNGTGIVACGVHPVDMKEISKDEDKLWVISEDGTDGAFYTVFCAVPPDRLRVSEWYSTDTSDTEPRTITVYESIPAVLSLQSDRIYELFAEWEEENQDRNGFYGEASYAVVTK